MGIQANVECQKLPAEFMQLLASCVMQTAAGGIFLNFIIATPAEACDCDPLIDCDTNHLPPESILRQLFTTDGCGHLAIVLGNCDGTIPYTEEEAEPQ